MKGRGVETGRVCAVGSLTSHPRPRLSLCPAVLTGVDLVLRTILCGHTKGQGQLGSNPTFKFSRRVWEQGAYSPSLGDKSVPQADCAWTTDD